MQQEQQEINLNSDHNKEDKDEVKQDQQIENLNKNQKETKPDEVKQDQQIENLNKNQKETKPDNKQSQQENDDLNNENENDEEEGEEEEEEKEKEEEEEEGEEEEENTIIGDNCVVCSNIPAKMKTKNLRVFFEEFGEIQSLWFEQQKGEASRHALVSFKEYEGLEKALSNKKTISNHF
ncbi:MAG: hypothetical protein EZS28_014076 [Streblomastix strix]|uniref:RRM domain-containing protein n=1 Tax=Streblomastix strix TaxID=222440 RepID=A0A5J4W6W8_9EUKA|nr:MAG: hypothetical protein EZS28_014076 [Streblomastix strix]